MSDERPRVEWDPAKARANAAKHNVTFEEAATAFVDQNAIVFDDPDHSDGEERFLLVGMSARARMLIVAHCIRMEGAIIRRISARRATRSERDAYTRGGRP